MHAFGVRSSSSQHFTSANPGFLFMPPSFREGVMGQAEPAPLLQPLRGRRCALNQLSYKCQPSPYSRTCPPARGSWGKLPPCRWGVMGECRGGLRGALRKSPWPHSAKKEDGSSPSSFKKQNSNSPAFALPQPFFQSLLFHGIQSKFTTLQHQ